MDTWINAALLVCFLWNYVGASEPNAPVTTCPTYFSEGKDLECACHSTSTDTSCKTYWRGHPDGPLLKKVNVRREDNGTRFTCEMDCSGHKSFTHYTLQVAYGPSQSNIIVGGPTSFLTDGNQTMELTCVSGDVNPAPSFKWTNQAGLQCMNGDAENTCLFKPKHFHDGILVSCKVIHAQTDTVVSADFTVSLTYPPPTVPEIDSTHQLVKPGDILHCTVKGGKPMVSEINIKCKDQPFPCNRLVRDESSVTCHWNLDVNITDMDEVEISCSAVWEPDPELYAHVTKVTITVQIPGIPHVPSDAEHDPQGQQESSSTVSIKPIVGGITAILVITIAVIVVYVIKRHMNPRYEIPPPRREDEHLYTGLQVMPPALEPQPVARSTEPAQGVKNFTSNCDYIEDNNYCEISDRVV